MMIEIVKYESVLSSFAWHRRSDAVFGSTILVP
jgi:hypothetical protein